MDPAQEQVQPLPGPAKPWVAAVRVAFIWVLIGSALTGLFALVDEFRLRQPFDNLVEAMVVIVPVSLPVVAGRWHRSCKVAVLLGGKLLVVGLCFVVVEMMLFKGWSAK